MNYHARWEAGQQGPRILFGHCPYAAIIEKHPELCQMDAALLKELFGDDMEQIAKIENFQGMCIFVTR
jgi:predicted ArsR family transcriptional regulator